MIRYIARLSWMEKGPLNAKDFLEQRGIALVIEPHLPNTFSMVVPCSHATVRR